MWQVQAILKTPVEGVSKVVIFIGDKTGKQKPSRIGILRTARRQAHHRRRRDHPLRRASLCRLSRPAAADAPTAPIAARHRRIWNWSSLPTSNARTARRRRPTWTSWSPIFPRPASSSRTIPWSRIHPAVCDRGRVRRLRRQAGRQHRILPVCRRRSLTARMAWQRRTAPRSRSTAPSPRRASIRPRSPPAPPRLRPRPPLNASVKLGQDLEHQPDAHADGQRPPGSRQRCPTKRSSRSSSTRPSWTASRSSCARIRSNAKYQAPNHA